MRGRGSILTPPPSIAAGPGQKGIPYPLHAQAAGERHRPVLRMEAAGEGQDSGTEIKTRLRGAWEAVWNPTYCLGGSLSLATDGPDSAGLAGSVTGSTVHGVGSGPSEGWASRIVARSILAAPLADVAAGRLGWAIRSSSRSAHWSASFPASTRDSIGSFRFVATAIMSRAIRFKPSASFEGSEMRMICITLTALFWR